jgi:hypothetical protein
LTIYADVETGFDRRKSAVKTAAAFAAWACRHRLRSAASENAAPPLPRPRVAHAAIDLDIKRKLEEEVSNRWFVPKEALLRRQVVGVKHALKQLYLHCVGFVLSRNYIVHRPPFSAAAG